MSLVGVGTSLATQKWDPLWNPFRPEPEKVITKMAKRMEEVKTIHTDLNAEMEIKDGRETDIKIVMSVDTDSRDQNNLKSAALLDINVATEGTEFSFDMEGITIGRDSYVKITTIPFLVQMFGIDPKKIKNQWYSLNKESLTKFLGKEYAGEEESKKKNEEITQKLKDLTGNKNLYAVKEELADEKIGETKAYHYIVSLNQEEIKKILPDAIKIFSGGDSSISGEQVSELQKEVNKFFEGLGELSGDLWVGKKDKFIYRFKGEKTFSFKGAGGKVLVKVDIDFSRFNQSLNIEPPKNFKNFEEIFPLTGDRKSISP